MCDKDVLQNQNIKTKQISISSPLSSLQPNFLNFQLFTAETHWNLHFRTIWYGAAWIHADLELIRAI